MAHILQDGDTVLRQVCPPVPPERFGTSELDSMLRDMEVALDKEHNGVALAAPQIGLSYRIFIVRYDRMERDEEKAKAMGASVGVFINPEIIKSSRKREEMQEGCLSVRGLYGTTLRHERATVRAQDASGAWFTRGGGGILAQAYQHEIDHLDGILFIDHADEVHEETREETKEHGTEPA